MDISFESQEFTNLLYSGKDEYEKFLQIKNLKETNEVFKFRPETYAYEPNEHLEEEGKVLIELIKLHRSKKLDLRPYLPYLSDLTHYSRTPEVHFNLFKTICLSFASKGNAEMLTKLIDDFTIVGSVLYQEFNFNTNVVNDDVEATVKFCPHSKNLYLSTPENKAKLCRYYTPHSNKVVVFARLEVNNTRTAPLPFLVNLRDQNTLEYSKGIKLVWLGPSFGGISGREYAFQFDNYNLGQSLALDKFVRVENGRVVIEGDDQTIEFITRTCFLIQQSFDLRKSSKEALKASYLTIRYAKNRTQFKTLEEKGKERSIFEYNYNKTRIVRGLVEAISFSVSALELGKNILATALNPSKNFEKLNDFFVFFDAYEAFVHERCLIAVETLRESIGGIGFLKYSGIPNLQENALKNAVFSAPTKNLRYLKLADIVTRANLQNKSGFFRDFASSLTEKDEANVWKGTPNFQSNSEFLTWFFARRVITLRNKINDSKFFANSTDYKTLLGQLTNFDDIQKLADSFIIYVIQGVTTSAAGNNQFIRSVVDNLLIANLLEDVPHLMREEKTVLPEQSVGVLKERLDALYNGIGKKGLEIIESFGFDENLLHSCISKTADETYAKMLDMSKNHNPRNNEAVQKEIRAGLIKFLNRPQAKL